MKYTIELTPQEHLIIMQALGYMVIDENVNDWSRGMAYQIQSRIKREADKQRRDNVKTSNII